MGGAGTETTNPLEAAKVWQCHCGKCLPMMPDARLVDTVHAIYRAQDGIGGTITIASAIRCERWNAKQGGMPNSQHLLGTAADLHYQNAEGHLDPERIFSLVAPMLYRPIKGLGFYPWGLHVDVRDSRRLCVWHEVGKKPLTILP